MNKPLFLCYTLGLSLILPAYATPKPEPIIPGTLIPASAHKPAYPAQSIDEREEGSVTLKLMVDAQGTVTDVQLVKSSGFPRLDRSASKTAQTYRYTPASQGQKAVPFQHRQSFHFNIPIR